MSEGGGISRAEWDHQYTDGRWAYLSNAREAPRYRALAERVTATRHDPAVLDIGCGECLLYGLLGGPAFPGRYLGIDWSAAALSKVRCGPGHSTVCADAGQIPVRVTFDVVVCSELLYYLSAPLAAVRGWLRLLNPGGELAISLFQPNAERHPGYHRHIRDLGQQLVHELGARRLAPVTVDSGRRTWAMYVLDGKATT